MRPPWARLTAARDRRKRRERQRAEAHARLEGQLQELLRSSLLWQVTADKRARAYDPVLCGRDFVMHPEWWHWCCRLADSVAPGSPLCTLGDGREQTMLGYTVIMDPSYGAPELR